jgi:hypothetical protein
MPIVNTENLATALADRLGLRQSTCLELLSRGWVYSEGSEEFPPRWISPEALRAHQIENQTTLNLLIPE